MQRPLYQEETQFEREYPLSDKIDYKISGGLGLNNLDAKGLNLLGNPTVDDSGTALVMYWQTSLSYQINNKYSISLAYQYLGENDETTWTTGEKIDYSLSREIAVSFF